MKKRSFFGKTVAFVDSEGKITTPSSCFKVSMPLIYATGCKNFFAGETWYDVLCFIVSRIERGNPALSHLLKCLTYEEYIGELFFRSKKVCVPEEFILIVSFMKSECFVQMGIRGRYEGIVPQKLDFPKDRREDIQKVEKKTNKYKREKWLCLNTYRYPDMADSDIGYSHLAMKKYIDTFMEAISQI